ncbi:MAG: biotin transporter BioY [Lachnospiraceae bacterium]
MKTKDITMMGLCVAILCICSWLTIPATVPFTLQTFAVFFILLVIGGKRGTITILTYILLGLVGAPVFSGFKGGVSVLFGTTGGYILGFLFTGLLFWVFERLLGRKLWMKILALLLGLAVCYTFGTIWFVWMYGRNVEQISMMAALGMCVFPFLIPDAAKLVLAVAVSGRVRKLMGE